MKANDGSGNNSSRDEWETPGDLFYELEKQYNFTFDCCATWENKKAYYYSEDFLNWFDNAYFKHSYHICWMNPPFSKSINMFKHFFEAVKKGVAIYRCDNLETKIWQDVILPNADWIFIPKGRVCYEGMNGYGSRFPSALIGVGVDPPKNINGVFLKKG